MSLHLLLLLILLAGPAFLSSKPKESDPPLLDFIPAITVDEALSGGGNRSAQPPPPAPVPRQPEPRRPEPTPEPEVTRPRPPQRSDSVTPAPKKRKIKPKLDLTTRPTERQQKDPRTTDDNSTERAFNDAIQTIQSQTSGRTRIEMPGPGTSGVSYANFEAALKKKYTEAWMVPDGVTDDSATVFASVTIARDGRVLRSRIVSRSGNAAADVSVQQTLDRVRVAVPLPEGAKESERTVTIQFDVRARRGTG